MPHYINPGKLGKGAGSRTTLNLQPEIPSASESRSHGTVWVRMDLKEHLVPAFLPWTGTLFTRAGCSHNIALNTSRDGEGGRVI